MPFPRVFHSLRISDVDAEVEAPERGIFYGSRSSNCEMNGSGSSKKVLEVEAKKKYCFHRFHYYGI